MEVEIFSLADFAANTGNGKLTIVGTFDTLTTHQMPVLQMCSLVLKLRISNAHVGKHKVLLKFLDPEGREFMPSPNIDIEVLENQFTDYNAIPIVLNLHPMKLDKIGKYAIELYYDEEFHSGLKLMVIQSIPVQKAA
ncbi:MAG TPA: hypothetical protein VL443_13740 [Cyclobacteriaceae bacterium]|jgi:hypothetical protein|nr:hypothetical protein [Cyclobacteriaceae bacterium]